MSRRKALVVITKDILRDLIKLPEDLEFQDFHADFQHNCIVASITGDEIPETEDGSLLPIAVVKHIKHDDGTVSLLNVQYIMRPDHEEEALIAEHRRLKLRMSAITQT